MNKKELNPDYRMYAIPCRFAKSAHQLPIDTSKGCHHGSNHLTAKQAYYLGKEVFGAMMKPRTLLRKHFSIILLSILLCMVLGIMIDHSDHRVVASD